MAEFVDDNQEIKEKDDFKKRDRAEECRRDAAEISERHEECENEDDETPETEIE